MSKAIQRQWESVGRESIYFKQAEALKSYDPLQNVDNESAYDAKMKDLRAKWPVPYNTMPADRLPGEYRQQVKEVLGL